VKRGGTVAEVLLALGMVIHYRVIWMLNRVLVLFMMLSLGIALSASGQGVESERKMFNGVKSKAEHGDPEAQLQLGFLYLNGTGVAPDAVKAFKWQRKAAEQGLAQGQFQVGLDYAEGQGVKMDKAEAVHWFRAAAENGFAQAQLELGFCYLEGRGVSENGTEALQHFRKASSQGVAYADYEIGTCYLQGIGVAKDVEQGTRWIRLAADKGIASSQNALGLAYEKGEGVPKDLVQAYKWYALAAAQDDAHAADIRLSLAKLETNLTKDQIAEAQRLAREFKPLSHAANPPSGSSQDIPQPGVLTQSGAAHPTGLVNVTADTGNCDLFVDGAFVGNSPAKLRLAEGAHVLQIKKSGFKDYRCELKVTAGSELTLHPVLERQ
jgi:TPR repeat protein